MSRKLTAGIFALAILVAGGFTGLRLTGSHLESAATGPIIARSQAKEDRAGREAAAQAAILAQQQERELKLAAATPRVEQDRTRREATEQQAALTPQQEEERKLADAFRWADRYRQQREGAEQHAASKGKGSDVAEFHGGLDPELTRRRAAAQQPVLAPRQEEERILAEARAKAEGVHLAQRDLDQSGHATGSVGNCPKGCKAKTNTPRSRAVARRAANGAHAQGRRARVAHATNVTCPTLRWLQLIR